MTTNDSFLAVVEKTSVDETVGFPGDTGKEKWLSFPREELLTEPNSDFANQTQINHVNGNSNTLEVRSSQLPFFPPSLHPARERFKALQKWEGYVINVGPDTFSARLMPIKGEGHDQEADIYLEELDEEDRALIEPGSVFYWSIGYLDGPSGRRRHSVIRFRRLPTWTRHELETARTKAARLRNFLDVE